MNSHANYDLNKLSEPIYARLIRSSSDQRGPVSMDTILIKIFATALALSEVVTQPQAVKTHFDPFKDQDEVVQILRNGCAHMRRAFDIESINLDDLISTALNDPKVVGADIKTFHGINFADLNTAITSSARTRTSPMRWSTSAR